MRDFLRALSFLSSFVLAVALCFMVIMTVAKTFQTARRVDAIEARLNKQQPITGAIGGEP